MSAVSLNEVGCAIDGTTIVESLNLDVAVGEFVTLLGPSGCGKTTTLRMVAGLQKNSSGRITIGGHTASDAQERIFVDPERRDLGMVFQSYAIWPHMTVFENVAYPLQVRRQSKASIRPQVEKALRLVEMSDYIDRPAPALSGGQQQRIAIARALISEPKVLLLDEPLSNLDAKLRVQMGDEFRSLQKRLGITCLYVTHDQEEAMSLSDRIVVMSHGKILQTGTPEDVYQRPATRQVATFFGSPNLLPAKVVGGRRGDTGDAVLHVETHGWSGEVSGSGLHPNGAEVLLVLRPESFSIDHTQAESGAGDQLSWKGRITQSIFRGSYRSLSVDSAGLPFHVEGPAYESIPLNGEVRLSVPSKSVWAVAP
jgi:iron(III) transport system ATP-binding protein